MEKHLEFYNKCLETGRLPLDSDGPTGLCGAADKGLISRELLMIFKPTKEDDMQLSKETLSRGWWGSGVGLFEHSEERQTGFTPLRQTIVAFMCVIKLEEFGCY